MGIVPCHGNQAVGGKLPELGAGPDWYRGPVLC